MQLARAALVGLAAGAAAALYRYLVVAAEHASRGLASRREELGFLAWILVPLGAAALGGLAGWITFRFAPETSGSGIPDVKATLLGLRQIRALRLIAVKLTGGFLALAGGFALGREGPTVQVGAATGQLVGDSLRVPRRSRNALIAAGAGAGLAGAFNAPLAGFLFVMEELKREMSPMTFGTALIASVCAVLVTRAFSGQSPSFLLPESRVLPLSALVPAALLGLLAALAGMAFNRALLWASAFRRRIPGPPWLPAAAVGAVAGVFLLVFPRVTGVGHGLTEQILTGQLQARDLAAFTLAIFALKFLLTTISYGSGVPGGIFAPMLVMGSSLGCAFGLLADRLFPGLGISPAVFATIGMAALLTASVRAPLTAVVLIVEMTNEYSLLFPLLLGCFVAYVVAEALESEPIYEALLQRALSSTSGRSEGAGEISHLELLIEPESLLAGRRLRDAGFPSGARVTNLVRQGEEIIPHGETRLLEGDLITVAVEHGSTEATFRILESVRGM